MRSLVPETLVGRELFGNERAAIPSLPGESTGALARYASGTVLIEHVESLPEELQQNLALALARGPLPARSAARRASRSSAA